MNLLIHYHTQYHSNAQHLPHNCPAGKIKIHPFTLKKTCIYFNPKIGGTEYNVSLQVKTTFTFNET